MNLTFGILFQTRSYFSSYNDVTGLQHLLFACVFRALVTCTELSFSPSLPCYCVLLNLLCLTAKAQFASGSSKEIILET